MASKFARVAQSIRKMSGQVQTQPSAGRLTRPPVMDQIRYNDDHNMVKVGLVCGAVFGVYITFQAVDWTARNRHYDKNKDIYADFEKQKKAGVFMSIRPDGTYRKFYKMTRTYESEPYLEVRDADGLLVYKEDLAIAVEEAQENIRRMDPIDRRRSRLEMEIVFLTFHAVHMNIAQDYGKALEGFNDIREAFITQGGEEVSANGEYLFNQDFEGEDPDGKMAQYQNVCRDLTEEMEASRDRNGIERVFGIEDSQKVRDLCRKPGFKQEMQEFFEKIEFVPESLKEPAETIKTMMKPRED